MAWTTVRLGDVVSHRKAFIEIDSDEIYKRCRVQTSARGVVLRDHVEGSAIKTKRQQVCRASDFLVAEIDAKVGGYGVVPPELHGAIVSSHYFLYETDQSKILSSYLDWFSKTHRFFEQVRARGSTNYAAIRPEAVLSYTVPLPSLDDQRAIVRRLDEVQTKLRERTKITEAADLDARAMLFNIFQRITRDVGWRPLAEIAPLNRRPVVVDPDTEYLELGARSFGRGLFHKPPLLGSSLTWQQLFWIHEGDLVFSNIKAWEGAFGVASETDHMRVASHRYLTCIPDPSLVTPNFLWYYLQTADGLGKIGAASPGSADRNRTLGQKALMAIRAPVPDVHTQLRFDELCAHVGRMRTTRASMTKEFAVLIPAMLHEIFGDRAFESNASIVEARANVVALPRPQAIAVDTPFKEAVLVGAIVEAFCAGGGQPLGNFRLQKAVYFARRHMGESALDAQYLRKAAGPYKPSMRYAGGIKIATDKKWIARGSGQFGEGSTLGSCAAEMDDWIAKYQFASTAAWVRDNFKFKSNDTWETLATVDYAMLALGHSGTPATAAAILAYVENDPEWYPKIAKLRLSEASIQSTIVELETLFVGDPLPTALDSVPL